MTAALAPHSIGGEPNAELHTAVRSDVEAADGSGQVQLPPHLQVVFRRGLEGAGG
jgi:hypothetical protein